MAKAPVNVLDAYGDALVIGEPVGQEVSQGVVRIHVDDKGPGAPMWIGNRAQLRELIEALEAWEKALLSA